MNYYQFHIADFALHTSHLTLEEEGVYRRLLDFYYDTESPIPKKTDRVIRRLRLIGHEETVAFILDEFFVLHDDGWHNLRADSEILAYNCKAETARANGSKGGRPKKNKDLQSEKPKETNPVILANQKETGSKANQEPETINQEPKDTHAIPAESASGPAPILELIDLFNKTFPELPQVKKISEARRKAIRRRWVENPELQTLAKWEKFFRYIRQSDFLMGKTPSPWHGLSFDWIFNSSNFTKIYEGNYHGDSKA